jgi:hypothetical protein
MAAMKKNGSGLPLTDARNHPPLSPPGMSDLACPLGYQVIRRITRQRGTQAVQITVFIFRYRVFYLLVS